MAERQWDKFEAALLIDTYNDVDSGVFKRDIAVAKLSNNLRKRAENLGLSIDSKYRNANGISMMLSTLVYLFSDGTKQPFKMPNKMFQEVYKIYRDTPKEFETLLAEAKKQCSDGFDVSTLSMANYKSLIQNKSITGLNFEIVNKTELLKVRFIEHCIQAKRKGSLVWVENSDLIVWLKMLDIRLINIRIINDSIFNSKDFYKFYRYRKYNRLEVVLRTLLGKYNCNKLSDYIDFYIKYVKSLSYEDKLYLGFKTEFEENGVGKEKEEAIEAHSGIVKENSDTPKALNEIEKVVPKIELEDTVIKSYQNEKVGFIKFCKDVYNIGYVFANENLTLLLELEKKLITENKIEFSLFDFRDYEKIKQFTYQVDFKKTISRHYEKQLFTRVCFYFKVLLIYLSKSIAEYNSTNGHNGKFTRENEAWLRSNSKEIVSVRQDKPVLEEPRDGVTRTVGSSNNIRKDDEDKHKQVAKKDEEKVPNHENESESDDAGDINEERFAAWLAQNAPSNNLGELYTYYSDVTDFCIRINVLKKPLLKTVQLSVVKKVQKVVNENRLFKVTHRKSLRKIIAAVQYYVNYIKMLNTEPKTIELTNSTIEKVVPLLEETTSEVVKEIDEVKVVNEAKQAETADVTEGINTIHQIEEADTTQEAYYTVDFNNISDLAYSFPVELTYFKKSIQIEKKWRDVYISIVRALYEQYPNAIPKGKSFSGKGRVDFGNRLYARFMIAPKEVVNNMYLETNLSATDIVGKIKALLDLCHIFYDDIIIKYGYKDEHHLPEEKKETCTHKTNATIVQGSILEEKEIVGGGVKLDNKANNDDIHDLLLETIIKDNVEYADKRSKGGCLWVALSRSDEDYIEKLRDFGAQFKFAPHSGALGFRDGWWTQDIINNINEESGNKPDPAPVNPSSETYENFIHMLNKYYSKGFRVGSGIEIKKFKSQWQSEFNKDMPSDSIINKYIDDLTITIGKKAYLPDILLPAQIKEKIFAYISDSFASDKHMIYYEALYNHFSQELLNSHINNSNMLQAYLRRTNYVNHFYLCEKYFSDIKTIHMDPVEDVRKYLTEAGKPVSIDQIYADLSQISSSEIYKILTGIGSREFINNQKGEYFHVSIVDLSSTDIKNIKEIIDNGLYNYGFISGIDFWNKLKKKHPDMIAQYPYLTDLGMRSVLAFHLGDNYDFKGTIISKKGEKVKSSDVYRRFAQQNTEFTIDDLVKLSEELNTGIYYDEVYNYSVRINDNKFISRGIIDFDVDAIDSMLESFCESDYASLETLSVFSGFPYCGYAWNIWLLESFVAKYSKKFILLHSNYNATKCVGAIVKISADINTFDELLSRALADSSVQLTQNMMDNIKNALSYFVQNGFLARKSYSTIESIVNNAIKLR